MTWISALVIPLLTIALSGVVSSVVTFRLSSSRADRDFRLQKLEDMLSTLQRFLGPYALFLGTRIPLMRGQVSVEEVQRATAAGDQSEPGDLQRVEMLVMIYFPRLHGSLHRFLAQWEAVSSLLGDHIVQSATGEKSTSQELDYYVKAIHEVMRLADVLREEAFVEGSLIRESGIIRSVRQFAQDQIG